MRLQQAVAFAIERAKGASQEIVATGQQSSPDVRALSPRERDVALLVAQGRSNHEISEALVIAERTTESHVAHILNKLGLRSRAQLAVWALEHGLSPARRV